jgi:hypothetical protein
VRLFGEVWIYDANDDSVKIERLSEVASLLEASYNNAAQNLQHNKIGIATFTNDNGIIKMHIEADTYDYEYVFPRQQLLYAIKCVKDLKNLENATKNLVNVVAARAIEPENEKMPSILNTTEILGRDEYHSAEISQKSMKVILEVWNSDDVGYNLQNHLWSVLALKLHLIDKNDCSSNLVSLNYESINLWCNNHMRSLVDFKVPINLSDDVIDIRMQKMQAAMSVATRGVIKSEEFLEIVEKLKNISSNDVEKLAHNISITERKLAGNSR